MTEDIKMRESGTAKNEKMNDKIFMKLIVTAIVAMLICATGLVSTTWAWYTSTLSSADNNINSATFEIELSVVDAVTGTPVATLNSADHYFSLEKGTYIVSVKRKTDSTATVGYVIVTETSDTSNRHYTAALTSSIDSLAFTLEIKRDTAVTVKFKSNWGSPSADELLSDGKSLILN